MQSTVRPLKALMPTPSSPDVGDYCTRPVGRSESIDSTDTCTDSTTSEADGLDGSARGCDDKAVVVLTTSELQPLENVADEVAAMRRALQNHDWVVQYGAIETLRRAIVHHTEATLASIDQDVLRRLQDATLNLRSAMSKNALAALAECFEFAPDELAALDVAPVVESILNRAACEKKFLRDAADCALVKLATCVPTHRVLAALASVASSKNNKLCVAGCSSTVRPTLEGIGGTRWHAV
ncbi:hypothetical protein, variant [Aphanomyces invadans]|uniref:CLASP N-terminal domain-containing protein n=1 Tax=Aphanomyces invadans TaxID=157072 RepID=A0A024TSA8_9STRA|nr:hypothetical protein, variant [Aphanomyces invadans]ETV97035.1 hypothetical protein, variant [Aphanomyces invadans]|eukprot:XP_008874281.1 hypothetical protein, variant [Aphanomyces invadans]